MDGDQPDLKPGIKGVSHHARERMAQRLGRDLSYTEWLDVLLQVTDPHAVVLRKQGDGLMLIAVTVGTQVAKLWWDSNTTCIITVLSADMVTRGSEQARATPIARTRERPPIYIRGERRHARTLRVDD